METHTHLLTLIETAEPSDTARLREIDARVVCFLNKRTFKLCNGTYWYDEETFETGGGYNCRDTSKYTRSRNALKAIRPKGWMIYEMGQNYDTGVWYCQMVNPKYSGEDIGIGEIASEELAELHAIIQAIAHDRAGEGE